MQSYGDFCQIPKNKAKSSPSCCDGVGGMRQREAKGQKIVAKFAKSLSLKVSKSF